MPVPSAKGEYLLQLKELSEQLPKVEPNVVLAQGSGEVLAGITSDTQIMRHLRSVQNQNIDAFGFLPIASDLNAKVEINTREEFAGVIRLTQHAGTSGQEKVTTYRAMGPDAITTGMNRERSERLGRLSNTAGADGKEKIFVQVSSEHLQSIAGSSGDAALQTYEEVLLDNPTLLGSLGGDQLMQKLREKLKLSATF